MQIYVQFSTLWYLTKYLLSSGGGSEVDAGAVEGHNITVGIGHRCVLGFWLLCGTGIQALRNSDWAGESSNHEGHEGDESELHDCGLGDSRRKK